MHKRQSLAFGFFLIFLICVMVCGNGFAHPLSPSLWDLIETAPGHVSVLWKTPVARVPGEDVSPALLKDCRTVREDSLTRERTYWMRRSELQCKPSWIAQSFAIDGLSNGRSNVILKIRLADGRQFQHVLNAEMTSFKIPERENWRAVLISYASLGVHHILSGWDHLLFVLGLFLLAKTRRPLLFSITAFTLGHSVTLSLAILEIIVLPSHVIEVLIALSILLLACELLRDQHVKTTFFHRHTWIMAFGFGLLHGLGFAGALAEVGLPMGDIPLALFSFNLGIEAGQLSFIAVLLLLRRVIQLCPVPALLKRVEIPAYGIGSLAAFWFFERLHEWVFP